MGEKIKFYGAPMSMYSGKARAYLRKQGIAFDEVMPGHPHFKERIYPKTQRGIVPAIEMPNGDVLQDTVDILDYFERSGQGRFSVYPQTPVVRIAALMLDMFGSEGLFKVAMHYRWNFLEQNESFIRMEFGDHIVPGANQDTVAEVAEKVMRPMQAYLPLLGINESTIPAIESQYLELLELLNEHFSSHPYLLGGLPSVADYGLFAPLYAHLSRDPYPGMIMKQKAQRVYRWVERMNAENSDTPEYPNYPAAFFQDDEIPQTLKDILDLVRRDFLPEFKQTVAEIDGWLQENPVREGQCVTAKPGLKYIKKMDYVFRDVNVSGIAMPYQLYMHQRITDYYASVIESDKACIDSFFTELDMQEWLALKAQRRVERHNLIEVWGEAKSRD